MCARGQPAALLLCNTLCVCVCVCERALSLSLSVISSVMGIDFSLGYRRSRENRERVGIIVVL